MTSVLVILEPRAPSIPRGSGTEAQARAQREAAWFRAPQRAPLSWVKNSASYLCASSAAYCTAFCGATGARGAGGRGSVSAHRGWAETHEEKRGRCVQPWRSRMRREASAASPWLLGSAPQWLLPCAPPRGACSAPHAARWRRPARARGSGRRCRRAARPRTAARPPRASALRPWPRHARAHAQAAMGLRAGAGLAVAGELRCLAEAARRSDEERRPSRAEELPPMARALLGGMARRPGLTWALNACHPTL